MYNVNLGRYMEPLHFKTLKKAQEFCDRFFKEEKILLIITEEKEGD